MRRLYLWLSVGLALLFLLVPATVLAQWSTADSGLEFKGVVEDMRERSDQDLHRKR